MVKRIWVPGVEICRTLNSLVISRLHSEPHEPNEICNALTLAGYYCTEHDNIARLHEAHFEDLQARLVLVHW